MLQPSPGERCGPVGGSGATMAPASGRRGLATVFLQQMWLQGRPPRAAWLAGGFALAAAAGGLALRNNGSPDAGAIVAGGGGAWLAVVLGLPDARVMRLLGPTPASLGRLWCIAALPSAAATLAGVMAATLLAGVGAAALPVALAAATAALASASLVALHGVFRPAHVARASPRRRTWRRSACLRSWPGPRDWPGLRCAGRCW